MFLDLKQSLTREAPTPTNISTKSDPEMVKKRYPCLSGYCLGKKSLTCSRRSYKKDTLWDSCSKSGVFSRITKEINYLCNLLLFLL